MRTAQTVRFSNGDFRFYTLLTADESGLRAWTVRSGTSCYDRAEKFEKELGLEVLQMFDAQGRDDVMAWMADHPLTFVREGYPLDKKWWPLRFTKTSYPVRLKLRIFPRLKQLRKQVMTQ